MLVLKDISTTVSTTVKFVITNVNLVVETVLLVKFAQTKIEM